MSIEIERYQRQMTKRDIKEISQRHIAKTCVWCGAHAAPTCISDVSARHTSSAATKCESQRFGVSRAVCITGGAHFAVDSTSHSRRLVTHSRRLVTRGHCCAWTSGKCNQFMFFVSSVTNSCFECPTVSSTHVTHHTPLHIPVCAWAPVPPPWRTHPHKTRERGGREAGGGGGGGRRRRMGKTRDAEVF